MNNSNTPIDVVVCHYNRARSNHLHYMLLHSMSFLCKHNSRGLNITVVDGSPERDRRLSQDLAEFGVQYLHLDRELSFAETYNAGIRRGSAPVVVTLANDILIEADQVRLLASEICDDVASAFCYLSICDYGTQRERKLPVPRRCFPSTMTINVNAFSREAIESVGLIPEQMSGCYNDVLLFIKLREAGYLHVLRNLGHVMHIGQQTLKTGTTRVNYYSDAAFFSRHYPQYWRREVVLFHKVAQRWATRAIYGLVEYLPPVFVKKLNLWNLVWLVEPYVCAERGTVKKAIGRALRPIQRLIGKNT